MANALAHMSVAALQGSALLQAKPQQTRGRLQVVRVSADSTPRVNASTAATAVADRPVWCPGVPPPEWLDGSLPADYGFDPLGLGKNSEALAWYQQAELQNARYAMLAVAGILIPGVLTKIGILNVPEWYEAGKVSIQNSAIPFRTLLAIQFLLYNFVELKRYQDFKKPKSQAEPGTFFGLEGMFAGSGEPGYPGGIFDPLGFAKDPKSRADLKLKELKNGRLAMVAFLGFVAQWGATGKGPLDNLADHLNNPAFVNFTTNGISLPAQVQPLIGSQFSQ